MNVVNFFTSRTRRLLRTARSLLLLILVLVAAGPVASKAADAFSPKRVPEVFAGNVSFRNEIQRSINKGLSWLSAQQKTNGYWSTADHPAITALVLSAFMGEPTGRHRNRPEVEKGYGFLTSCAQPDGSIHRGALINYNTSVSMMALLAAEDSKYHPILRQGRNYLAGTQMDFGTKGKIDSPFDGGVGYGSKYEHSDLNNTLSALEAMYHSRQLAQDKEGKPTQELNWEAVIHFIQSCQNLSSHNREPWVSDQAENRGGFVYYPGHSMAGAATNSQTGKVSLRSYGSISYAGLLSYIYADLKGDDPRITAAMNWLRRNYSLEENPGMGQQGYFYYLHLMTKALNTHGVQTLILVNDKKVNWREEVAMRLINLQKPDGSWVNDNGRWWEKDPHLVTAYALLTLEIIGRGI